jgi:hypothetical protein
MRWSPYDVGPAGALLKGAVGEREPRLAAPLAPVKASDLMGLSGGGVEGRLRRLAPTLPDLAVAGGPPCCSPCWPSRRASCWSPSSSSTCSPRPSPVRCCTAACSSWRAWLCADTASPGRFAHSSRVRFFAVLLAPLAAFAILSAPDPAARSRPNVVVIMTDDQTYRDMAAMPQTRALIGAAGATFTRTYVS